MPHDTTPKRYRSLVVDINDSDIAWATKQNRYGCAIVRAIERALPDALHVRADTKEIAFSLPADDTRYFFETPPEVVKNVIMPFDKGEPITDRTFILNAAYSAEPIRHRTREQKVADRAGQRQRRSRRADAGGRVHSLNRFLDYEAEQAQAQHEEEVK